MVAIRASSFGGIRPKLNARYLGEDGAQIANNVDTTRQGALTPVHDLGDNVLGGNVGLAVAGFIPKTLFRYGIDYLVEDGNKWVSSTRHVNFARGQITGDEFEVLYFTDNSSEAGGFIPQFTDKNKVGAKNQTILGGAVSGLTQSFPLGVNAPTIAPKVVGVTVAGVIEGLTIEYRTYVFTHVYTRSGREMESAPSPASPPTKYYLESGQLDKVNTLTRAVPEGGGHMAASEHKKRIYRAVAGTFLFVDEIPGSTQEYTDRKDAAELGEPLPSLTWSPPDPDMKGLVNMANGIMAGFNGRDIFFCEPYIPHAWPINYTVTVDSPVVAIVSLDTTLVVLTNERPYFVQGSDPSFMTVVEADIAQACIAPRSAAKLGGECYFSSPDGLVTVSSRGSKIITENIFSYRQWNEYFETDSIIGYVHDLKYYGFFKSKNTSIRPNGVFIYDIPTRQFTMSTVSASAAFADLRFDKLYVMDVRKVRAWGEGAPMSYTWKSKIFGMPSEVSFSCMQIEAESYDSMTYKLYADGSLLQEGAVTSRNMMRIKSVLARDWEIQLEGKGEVFNIALAQAGQELARK